MPRGVLVVSITSLDFKRGRRLDRRSVGSLKLRRLSCDQDEFESGSEQSLELAIASPSKHCCDLCALLVACQASATRGPTIPPDWSGWLRVMEHLRRFAAIDLPHPSQVREAILINDEWNDVELGLAIEGHLVWYHWSTSA
jgi:hypothetical protein